MVRHHPRFTENRRLNPRVVARNAAAAYRFPRATATRTGAPVPVKKFLQRPAWDCMAFLCVDKCTGTFWLELKQRARSDGV